VVLAGVVDGPVLAGALRAVVDAADELADDEEVDAVRAAGRRFA
jgi:hypothetical protein